MLLRPFEDESGDPQGVACGGAEVVGGSSKSGGMGRGGDWRTRGGRYGGVEGDGDREGDNTPGEGGGPG